MARLNLTIPDVLHERLDQHRDELNISKLVADFLEGVLDELLATPKPADPEIAQLVSRLQSAYDEWYSRGYFDGRRWTLYGASREELETGATNFGPRSGRDITNMVESSIRPYEFPSSFDYKKEIEEWGRDDLDPEGDPILPDEYDKHHYFEGWRDAVVETWSVVEPLLKKLPANAKATARRRTRRWEEAENRPF